METTVACCGYMGRIESKLEPAIVYWGLTAQGEKWSWSSTSSSKGSRPGDVALGRS